MRWKRPTGTALKDLPQQSGRWFHSPRFLEVKTARAWGGMPPSKFDSLPESDRALMIEFEIELSAMQAHEQREQEREAKRKK